MISEETGKIEDYISIFRIESAFQDLIQRIQKKIKKFQHLKDVMGDPNLLKNILEKGQDGEYRTRRGNNRIQKGDKKLYQCRICKKTYPKSQQLGGHLRKGHPIDEGLEVGQP
ncbi:unnamed protein product (macronuclear) [Paramecium tetraurelia]|uniref:C2H2-type domain-containing protein n=1 Tax=Paramecium tetraurelia TaxID=5888 RepID=A0CNU8_PARTE|nr:uncharacterized protein GSPATT00008907001 [Paramecium tetraurelia]CAK72465.1 unnamed protein product [Paramecium tetraurelia]|eukprot:XP_001439862.1 hypothetical protein (macronuclear) [Paramecium tetraurelia strain d4-2]